MNIEYEKSDPWWVRPYIWGALILGIIMGGSIAMGVMLS